MSIFGKAKAADKQTEILDQAKEDVESWYSYWETNNEKYKDNNLFVNSKDGQWDDATKKDYDARQKVRLTINMLRGFENTIIGEFRHNTPTIQVKAKADPEKVDQNKVDFTTQFLRTHTDNKKSKVAWQEALKNALNGYAALEMSTDYDGDDTFDQEIRLKNISNPLNAGFDPAAESWAKEDGRFSFYHRKISKKKFDKEYPDIEYPQGFNVNEGGSFDWGNEEQISVVKYAYREFFKSKLYTMSDGEFVKEEDLEDVLNKNKKERRDAKKDNEQIEELQALMLGGVSPQAQQQQQLIPVPPLLEITDTRVVDGNQIYICELIQNQILPGTKTKWPSTILPFLFVSGGSYIDNETGQEINKPFMEVAQDPQRAVNYSASENANAMKRSQYSKILHTVKQVEGHKKLYNDNSSSNRLPYNPEPGVVPPTVIPPTPISPIYMESFKMYADTLRFVTGMHNAVIGAQALERSGKALGHEIRQGNTSNFYLTDNIYRTMDVYATAVLELMPTIYDSTRSVILTAPDGSLKSSVINEPDGHDENGEQKYKNRIDSTKFLVKIETGAPFGLQKKEAQEALAPFALNPATQNITLDQYFGTLDLPNTPLLVERAKSLVPPQLQVKEGTMSEEEAQKMAQQQAQSPQAQLAQGELQAKQGESQAKVMTAQANMIKAKAEIGKIGSSQQSDQIKAQTEQTKAQAEIGKAQIEFQKEAVKANGAQKDQIIEQMGQAIQQLQQERAQLAAMIKE